jgi:hypothetical protein
MKTVNIYYDKLHDCLTFTRHRHIVVKAVVKVQVPDETERDGDCVILPDSPNACFKRRRTSPTELFIWAVLHHGDVSAIEFNVGSSTFPFYGKHKPGICLHGKKFPCKECKEARVWLESYHGPMTDEEFERRCSRKQESA